LGGKVEGLADIAQGDVGPGHVCGGGSGRSRLLCLKRIFQRWAGADQLYAKGCACSYRCSLLCEALRSYGVLYGRAYGLVCCHRYLPLGVKAIDMAQRSQPLTYHKYIIQCDLAGIGYDAGDLAALAGREYSRGSAGEDLEG